MPKVEFTPTFSFGNMAAIVTLFITLAGSALTGYGMIATNNVRIEAIKEDVDAMLEDRDRDRTIQLEMVRTLTAMQSDIRYLRQTVEQAAADQRGRP